MARYQTYVLAICSGMILNGCFLIDYRKQFEDPKNAAVGQVVDSTFYSSPHWQINRGSYLEFGFKDYRGCSYAFEIDPKTRIIRSWRYLSEAKLCWTHVPTA